MRRNPPRVLLALGWYDYRLHRGIEKYAQENGWHLCSDVTKEKVIPWGWEGDGILAWLGAGEDLADFVVKAAKPTVDFSFRRPQLAFPRVLADHAAAAHLAAEHFLSHGLTHFLFYSSAENWAFEETGHGFSSAISAAGFSCNWIRWHRSAAFTEAHLQWKAKRNWLLNELKKAPKPLAVFAASDDHALEVLECCETAGFSVPDQVSIIGMDNSLLAVDAMRTPISSVDSNMEMIGYRGAELLDRLMHREIVPPEPLRIPPAGLIARKSSDLIAVNHPGVAKSLKFLFAHFPEQIGVNDLARAAGMSRRAFHREFVNHVGRTPGHELQRVRIEHAKKVLVSMNEKMEVVANSCGYKNANSFWSAFKQITGASPKHYREQFLK
ncbi:MAG TPA: substrate-binding domain-containing protein [Verrucomicrobiae bacterium]|nr:substrate-binding domain-containing protein [Verrucomicrobiae bacterium]